MKRKAKVMPAVCGEKPRIKKVAKENINDKSKVETEEEVSSIEKPQQHMPIQPSESINIEEKCSIANLMPVKQNCGKNRQHQNLSETG